MSMPPYQYGYEPPLEYARRVESYARPGILTAVGVISIVVGSLSVLGSISNVATGIGYMVMSHVNFPPPVMAQPMGAQPQVGQPQATTMSAGSGAVGASASPAIVTPGPNGAVNRAPPPVVFTPFSFRVPAGASTLQIVEGSLSLCAAVLLIVAGSLMLRDSPAAWRLHWLWVVIKIPLIVVGCISTYWIFSSMMNGMTPMMGPGMPRGFGSMFGVMEAVIGAIISLIYPVALMFVLSGRSSKNWLAKSRSSGI
jgi:hypothetical protein